MLLQEGLSSQGLEDLLKEYIFDPEANTCEAYEELYDTDQIDDIPERLRALMGWLDTFRAFTSLWCGSRTVHVRDDNEGGLVVYRDCPDWPGLPPCSNICR